jgi:hypothetical protein
MEGEKGLSNYVYNTYIWLAQRRTVRLSPLKIYNGAHKFLMSAVSGTEVPEGCEFEN